MSLSGGVSAPTLTQIGTQMDTELDKYLKADNFETSATAALTGGVAANAKGAWVQLIAATARIYHYLLLEFNGGAVDDFFFDIGTGAGGAEVVLIADVRQNVASLAGQVIGYALIKCNIAAGTRLAARVATVGGGSDSAGMKVIGIG